MTPHLKRLNGDRLERNNYNVIAVSSFLIKLCVDNIIVANLAKRDF